MYSNVNDDILTLPLPDTTTSEPTSCIVKFNTDEGKAVPVGVGVLVGVVVVVGVLVGVTLGVVVLVGVFVGVIDCVTVFVGVVVGVLVGVILGVTGNPLDVGVGV